ncbi:helix-turn-helix transcriptional regulator [Ellagibacter sp.]|uniref:helix-turn-helix transcriptional regulator n=1 Tax=Ellagibacter sp. TaxID=2137578 RepID=UPI003AB23B9F
MCDAMYERDWRLILDSILRINSTCTVSALQNESLRCITSLVHCTQATIYVAEKNGLGVIKFTHPVVWGPKAMYMEEFLRGDFDDDPIIKSEAIPTATEVYRDSDRMPLEQLKKTKLYQKVYKGQGFLHALRCHLVQNGTSVGNISLFNSAEQGEFTNKDVAILGALAPHIALQMKKLANGGGQTYAMSQVFNQQGLTPREREVVMLLVSGESDGSVADRLCISHSTFKKHLYSAYEKLGVNNRAQLMALLNRE